MSDKTKQYWWLPWAVVIALVLAVGVVRSYFGNWFFGAPWSPASILVTKVGINEFSAGIADTNPYWSLRLNAFVVILLTFVVGPSLWVYGEIKNQSGSPQDALKKGAAWYIGALLIVASLQVVPTTVMKGMVFQNTWSSAEKNKASDELRSGLTRLGFDALEYYYLPRELDGGGQTFASPQGRAIHLTDLESYNPDASQTYTLTTVDSDTAIKIHGVSNQQGSDANFTNADGRTGRIEITMTVTPPGELEFTVVNGK